MIQIVLLSEIYFAKLTYLFLITIVHLVGSLITMAFKFFKLILW